MSGGASFPAGTTNAHHLVNRSSRPARYLEIGNRYPSDTVAYTDVDLACTKNQRGEWVFTHRDRKPY